LNNPGDYTEANAWQYTLTPALQDPDGLTALMGGPNALGDWLDRFFTTAMPNADKHLGQEAMIGQYAHGNEPSHHIAYLYAFTDTPWKGHALVRRIAQDFYTDQPNGILGNDDCGQMSAWYVLSTLGFYPVVPASGDFVLGAPLVRGAKVQMAGGRTLSIHADGFGADRPYAREARLNGKRVNPVALPYADLVAGGKLRFVMQSQAR
jgi:predicted alpha-1,2-mannosidase